MHLWRENTRMQIRWATGSLLEPLDDFFGFFLVWRTWRKYGEMDVSFWDVCVHDIGALIFWVLSNIYSQQNWSTPKAWQTDQVFASCYPLALLILVLIQFVSVHFSSPCLKVPQTFVFPISAKYIESSLDRHHHWLTTALWENGTTNFNYCERNVRSACLQLGRYLD